MKTKNPKTINELFGQKYGKEGTKSHKDFAQKAEAYMVAELVKESRKKAQLTQEELAQKECETNLHLKNRKSI